MKRENHDTPNNRPIHPACTANHPAECECDLHWQGWDGSEETQGAALATALRLDSRRATTFIKGQRAEGDETQDDPSTFNGGNGDSRVTPDGHFYKHSELMLCNAGVPMRRVDERGLPRNYAQTGVSWARAKAESNPDTPPVTTTMRQRSFEKDLRLQQQLASFEARKQS